MNDNTLDFEDLFEIITPSGVDSRLLSLDTAWQALKNSNSSNLYITNEFSAWKKWRDKISDSYISKVFATGTLNELDNWKARYSDAFKQNKGNSAPLPSVFKDKDLGIPAWAFVVLGAGVTIGLLYLLGKK